MAGIKPGPPAQQVSALSITPLPLGTSLVVHVQISEPGRRKEHRAHCTAPYLRKKSRNLGRFRDVGFYREKSASLGPEPPNYARMRGACGRFRD